ncbi:MAG: L-threonylcarbamoyladenylate synthase [Candidatus Riflebacteria bacterium]|nr:L-threonylcarbamoyladenylate synthase [Candidatus Riflebacteria bacterium]
MTVRCRLSDLLADPARLAAFTDRMRAGGVAALPTDTLYGLAADGDSPAGVQGIYALKGRDEGKPLILFLADPARLPDLGIVPTPVVQRVLARFWPGALTVVFPLARPAPGLAAFGFASLGVRVPADPHLRRLLAAYPGFLLTTSCNRSGEPPLPDPSAIEAAFSPRLDWLLDGGPLAPSAPSTVLDVAVSPPVVRREGRISQADLAATGIFDGR